VYVYCPDNDNNVLPVDKKVYTLLKGLHIAGQEGTTTRAGAHFGLYG